MSPNEGGALKQTSTTFEPNSGYSQSAPFLVFGGDFGAGPSIRTCVGQRADQCLIGSMVVSGRSTLETTRGDDG